MEESPWKTRRCHHGGHGLHEEEAQCAGPIVSDSDGTTEMDWAMALGQAEENEPKKRKEKRVGRRKEMGLDPRGRNKERWATGEIEPTSLLAFKIVFLF